MRPQPPIISAASGATLGCSHRCSRPVLPMTPPPLFPLFASLAGRAVLVVGGGAVARRKVAALLPTGARVRVGATDLESQLVEWIAEGRIDAVLGEFDPAWLEGAWLVVAATDDP